MAETTRVARRQSKELVVAHNALITPSASPPPVSAGKAKSTSRPPPKRTRTDSFNSSPSPSNRASSSSSQAIDPKLDEAWRASSRRLLDVWESLAERYNVPLDQDDIIDIRTVKLAKDRGVIRGLKKGISIGTFGAPEHDGGASSEDGFYTEMDDRDEETDDIDSFAQEPTVPVKIELEKSNRHVPPFRVSNVDDASDLKEFLEEEKRRRARDGEGTDEDDESDVFELLEVFSSSEDEEGEGILPHGGFGSSSLHSQPLPEFQRFISDEALTAADGDSSDDEFAVWEVDDVTPVRPTTASPSRTLSDKELPGRTSLSPTPSSIDLVEDQPPSPAHIKYRSAPRGHSKLPQLNKHPSGSTSASRRAGNIQLQTPPLSHTASSASASTPEVRSSPAVFRTSSPYEPSFPRTRSSPIASSSRTILQPPTTPKRAKTPAPKHVMEVVVPPRRVRKSSSTRSVRKSNIGHGHENSLTKASSSHGVPQDGTPRVKGKGKDIRQSLLLGDISDNELPPPPKAKVKPTIVLSNISDSELPSPTKRTPAPQALVDRVGIKKQPRKRKRSSTSSSVLQASPEHSPQTPQTPTRVRRCPSEPPRRTPRTFKGKERVPSASEFDSPDVTSDRRRDISSRSRSSARDRSSMPPAPLPYPPTFPLYPPPAHDQISNQRHPLPPPLPPIQDPQAQYGFMQAMHYISYYLSGNAGQPTPPPPNPYTYPPARPHTPVRHSRGRTRNESSSPPREPSSERSHAYSTPDHRYARSYDFGYSSGTSPPMSSSPMPSSPTTYHRHPVPNVSHRSKSRGRKVSFKFDSDDDGHVGYETYDEPPDSYDQTAYPSNNRSSQRKSRSNAKYPSANGHTSGEDSSSRRRTERGRTPGPSSRHARSESARSAR